MTPSSKAKNLKALRERPTKVESQKRQEFCTQHRDANQIVFKDNMPKAALYYYAEFNEHVEMMINIGEYRALKDKLKKAEEENAKLKDEQEEFLEHWIEALSSLKNGCWHDTEMWLKKILMNEFWREQLVLVNLRRIELNNLTAKDLVIKRLREALEFYGNTDEMKDCVSDEGNNELGFINGKDFEPIEWTPHERDKARVDNHHGKLARATLKELGF